MLSISLNLYQGLAVACVVYALGYLMVQKIPLLSKYCIPAPVVGGLVYALIHLGLRSAGMTLEDVFLKLTADDGVPAEPSAARGEKEEDEAG